MSDGTSGIVVAKVHDTFFFLISLFILILLQSIDEDFLFPEPKVNSPGNFLYSHMLKEGTSQILVIIKQNT